MRHSTAIAALVTGFAFTAWAGDHWPKAGRLPRTQLSDAKQIMATIEQRADRFETEFLRRFRSSTVAIVGRYRYRNMVDRLQDNLDNRAEAYAENNIANAQEELQDAMEAARNLNHFMLSAKWSSQAESQWRSVRKDLNKLAGYTTRGRRWC